MQSEIITIGDEILIGQIIDTNSAWIAQKLNNIGINVQRITSISDGEHEIISSVKSALNRSDLILITGGLGPTNDDITKKTLSDYFGMQLVEDKALLEKIRQRLEKYNIPMNRFNTEQAMVPDGATIIPNNYGTAACMWFEKDNKVVVSMPGVPTEMKGIMKEYVLEKIANHFSREAILHQTIMTEGIGESVLADQLSDWENNLPKHIKLAYLPRMGQVRLRLTAKGSEKALLQKDIDKQVALLQQIIPDNIFITDDKDMEVVVADLLKANNLTVATAESCTGGYLAHLFTQQAGSSAYFKGSITAYANEIKQHLLGVKATDLEQYGAVSQQVVEQMALGVKKAMNVDFAIATSGIAGPDGGTPEKPVGTIWIAVAGEFGVKSELLHLYKARERNIRGASLKALNLLRKILIQK